jgi:Secretion system C-terminal sorting domain
MAKFFTLILILFSFNLNAQWLPVGGGVFGNNTSGPNPGNVFDMEVYQNELYIIGEFDSLENQWMKNFAKWNGTSWSSLTYTGVAKELILFNGDLILAGNSGSIGPIINRFLWKWDGSNWNNLSDSIRITASPVDLFPIKSLKVINNSLRIGGTFNGYGSNSVSGYLSWDGAQFFEDSILSHNNICGIYDIDYHLGHIVLSGPCYLNISPTNSKVYKYDGVNLDTIPTNFTPNKIISYKQNIFSGYEKLDFSGGAPTFLPMGGSLTGDYFVHKNLLYTIGYTGRNIVVSDSILNYVTLGDTFPPGSELYAIKIFENELYVAGNFIFPGEKNKTSIVKYGGPLPNAIQWDKYLVKLKIFPNPAEEIVIIEGLSNSFQTLEIYDVRGKMIFRDNINNISRYSFSSRLFDPGLYLIHLKGESNFNEKLLVK